MKRDSYTFVVVSALFVALLGGWGVWELFIEQKVEHDAIFSREVVRYEPVGNDVVRYEYKGEKLPAKLVPDEDASKRTENSFTRAIEPPTEQSPGKYESIFYTQPTFVKDVDGWHYIEHATTTETAFNFKRQRNPVASLFWENAYAASVSPFASAGDGDISRINENSFPRGGSTGESIDYISAFITIESSGAEDNDGDDEYDINRGFVPFDTSAIPAGATITAASLNLFVTSTQDEENGDGGDFIALVETTQGTHTLLDLADWNNCGLLDLPPEGGARQDITGIVISSYLSWTLNATGMSWIKKSGQTSSCSATTGITCLGIREGHDLLDVSVSTPSSGASQSQVVMNASEQTGTANDPFLSVTYTVGSFSFWQFQDF